MNENHILEKYYENYLREVRKLSESSIGHYKNAINNISRFLVKENKIQKTLYEIKDMDELEKIKEFLYHDNDFMIQNQRGNRMYSAGLNNYLEFAKGENFVDIKNNSICLDIEMPIENPKEYAHKTWKRSSIINRQVMELADYLCEIDNTHKTFIAEKNKKPYMEGHHIIHMRLQEKFSSSLDVYANIICLCPICHRLLHYGLKTQKTVILNEIYEARKERLIKSGIKISKDDFVELLQ